MGNTLESDRRSAPVEDGMRPDMELKIIQEPIPHDQLIAMARATHGDMVKIVVDIERGILALGGEWHAEGEEALLEDGSKQANLWGANIYPDKAGDERIEYTSLINIRPKAGNRSMVVESSTIRQEMRKIIDRLLL